MSKPIEQTAAKLGAESAAGRKHHRTSPSSLQAREACSHYEPGGGESAAAAAGTRQHEAVERRSLDGLPTDEECAAVHKCIEFITGLEQTYAEKAAAIGKKYVHLNESYLPIDDEDTSAGYLDEAFILEDEASLVDYTFGQWDVEPTENNLQGYCYALGLFKQYPKLQRVTVYFVCPYLDLVDYHTFNRTDTKDMLLRIKTVVARSLNKTGEPVPVFLACFSCANKATCPALFNIAIKISEKYSPLELPKEFSPMAIRDSQDAAIGFKLAGLIEGWARAYKGRVTNLAVEDDAFLPPGYRVQVSKDRIITNSKAAFDLLKPVLTEDVLWSIVKLGISSVEEAVKARAPKGDKTEQAKQVCEMLLSKDLIAYDNEKVSLRAITKKKESND